MDLTLIRKDTPSKLGYRMPAEYGKREGTFLAWPHMEFVTYWGRRLPGVEQIYVQMITALEGETVYLLVTNYEMERYVKEKLDRSKASREHVVFMHIPSRDVWTRDYGPIMVANEEENKLGMVHSIFNAWGNKFPDLIPDTGIPEDINASLCLPYFHTGMVLEGGAIEVNGKGTLITTEPCLIDKNRNPKLKKSDTEKKLKDYFGAHKIIWLKEGLANDDTDGHIDNLIRFVDDRTVLCSYTEDRTSKNYNVLRRNFEYMKQATDQDGKRFEVVPLPIPNVRIDGEILPASYANFYPANGKVLVPTFDDEKLNDRAMGIIREHFPKRKVVGIDCRDLIPSSGAIHCVTQQIPAVK